MVKKNFVLLGWLAALSVSLLIVGCSGNTGKSSQYALNLNPATISINESSVATVAATSSLGATAYQDVFFSLESTVGTKTNSFASLSSESCTIYGDANKTINQGSGCSVRVQAQSQTGVVKIYAFIVSAAESYAKVPVINSPQILIISSSAPTPTPTAVYKTLFITESAYNGNLGGISGADAKCESEAAAAGLSGTYKALVVDSQRYPCDATGGCGTDHMHDWPLAVSTSYANTANSSVAILTTNASGVFESSYAQNLIKSATGADVSAFFWTGISGVQISGKADASEPATMSKWSYADESQSWTGSWGGYLTLTCSGWTTSNENERVSIGDNGLYGDESYARGIDVKVESGYAVQRIALDKFPAMPALSRWLTSFDDDFVLSTCGKENHLICVQQ